MRSIVKATQLSLSPEFRLAFYARSVLLTMLHCTVVCSLIGTSINSSAATRFAFYFLTFTSSPNLCDVTG